MSPNVTLNVIFVDDEPGLCQLFIDEYETESVVVTTYTDPVAAITAANRQPPDLVFLDYSMPGLNGDEVAQAIPADIPKYLISGDIKLETKTVFLAKFGKPLNFEVIGAVIDAAKRAKARVAAA